MGLRQAVILAGLLCACGEPLKATDPSRVVVEVISPQDGDSFIEGEVVTLEASIEDNDGNPTTVDGVSWEVFDSEWSVVGNPVDVTYLPIGELTLQAIADVGGRPVKDSVAIAVVSNEPESECDDEVDDDGDGLVDCADDDCAAEIVCSWPTSLSHSATIAYDASFLAELSGYSSCTLAFNGTFNRDRDGDLCPNCDFTFEGAVTYTNTSCSETPGDLPSNVRYGIVFTSDTAWGIWSTDGTSWGEAGTATGGGGTYTLSRQDPIVVDGNDAGDLNTTLSFTEL